MAELRDEIFTIIAKIWSAAWSWVCLVGLGVLGMLGHNLYLGKKMTFWQSVGSVLVSMFVGAVTSIFCYIYEYDRMGAVLVPMMTLVADKVMMAVISFNWQGSIKQVIKNWVAKWK